jgi:cell cycle arrest protein BUB3
MPVASIPLPGKAFALDVDASRNRIVVATSAGRRLVFIDYTGGKAHVVLDRESSLKYQTRCVQFFPDGHGIALGSIEGRVAVEFLSELGLVPPESSPNRTKYAFKCHRVQDTVYPVNAIAFCPTQPCTFATGGVMGRSSRGMDGIRKINDPAQIFHQHCGIGILRHGIAIGHCGKLHL